VTEDRRIWPAATGFARCSAEATTGSGGFPDSGPHRLQTIILGESIAVLTKEAKS
jgi:hypothetical protein